MNKVTIKISATTLGRGQYIPEYHQRKYVEKGDIPNHIAAALVFLRKELKPNEKIIVKNGKLHVVEKTTIDKLIDWAAGSAAEKSARPSRLLAYLQSPILNSQS